MKRRLAASLALLLTGCGSSAPTSPPPPPGPPPPPAPPGQELAFVRRESSTDSDIWIAEADGANKRPLTNSTVRDVWPHFDASGTNVYFVREILEFWRIGAEGSNEIQLVRISANDVGLWDLHPASGILARAGMMGVWFTDLNGQNQTQIVQVPQAQTDSWPRWSPGGNELSFVRRVGPAENLWVVSRDGSNPRMLAMSLSFISDHDWHPDGTRLVAALETANGRDLYEVPTDGSPITQLTNAGTAFDPEWSPDGSFIAFREGSDVGDFAIVLIGSNGSNRRVIAQGFGPSWSPDGILIAYCRTTTGGILGLATIGADGTGGRAVDDNGDACGRNQTRDGAFAWRP